jgi:hypothetical protein
MGRARRRCSPELPAARRDIDIEQCYTCGRLLRLIDGDRPHVVCTATEEQRRIDMLPKFLIVGFLLLHTAIHTSFLSAAPAVAAGGPQWPFDLGRSWLLSPVGVDSSVLRIVGLALVAAIVGGYALAVLASVVTLPGDLLSIGIALGSVASLALLAIFFSPWFVLGFVIDLGLLWAVMTRSSLLGLSTP